MRKNTIVPLTCEHCSNCLPRYSVFLFQPCNKLPSWDSNFWSSFFLHRTAPTEPNPSRLKIQRQAGRQNSRKSQQSLRIHPVHRANSNIARPLSVPALGRIGMVQRQSPFQNRRRRACSCALPAAGRYVARSISVSVSVSGLKVRASREAMVHPDPIHHATYAWWNLVAQMWPRLDDFPDKYRYSEASE
jgi:hypothetical protein